MVNSGGNGDILDADINSTNQNYVFYKDSGPVLDLILPAILLNLVAVPGIFLNIFLIIVTVKNKTLHGNTYFLITFISIFELLHQSSYLLFLGIVLSGTNFISLRVAFFAQFHSIFGFNATMTMISSVAADRLLAILASEFRDSLNKLAYLFVHLLLAFAYSIWMCFYIWEASIENPTRPVTGYLTETIIFGKLGYAMILLLTSCAIYALIGLIVKCKTKISSQTHSRILKSVTIIIFVNIIGYLLNISIFHMTIRHYWGGKNGQFYWRISIFCSFLLNIGAASNAPILYLTSSEYRSAFRKELCSILCIRQNRNIPLGTSMFWKRQITNSSVLPLPIQLK